MSNTELEDLQALLERVLSEPGAFAARLLQQAMTQYGPLTEPAATAFYTAMAEDVTAEDVTASDAVIVPDEWSKDEPVVTNGLLAVALGACECWGLWVECPLCKGRGSAGWTQPDPELFEEFVRPAVNRLSATPTRGHRPSGPAKAGPESGNHQSVQGENA